jgi:hypothetical protein
MKPSQSLDSGQPMYSTAAKLLEAAPEFVQGDKQLAVLIQLVATRTSGLGGNSNQ